MSNRNARYALIILLSALLILSCGKKKNAGISLPSLQFKTQVCIDKSGIGIEAFRMLIPKEWEFEGGIRWLLDNPGMPATASLRARNPSGSAEFEVFPNQPFFWTDNQMHHQLFPVGSRYYGNEVRPPAGPIEALRKIVLPRFRSRAGGLKVVKEEHLPELAKTVGAGANRQPGVRTAADGARIRIEYDRKGTRYEEEIYGVVESYGFPIQSMYGTFTNTIWTIAYLFSFKAEKGKLDSMGTLFKTIVSSFRVNPQWHNRYTQVVEYLIKAQIRQIQSVGELSRIISRTHNEISEEMTRSFEERQAVYDRVAEKFSQQIRDVDAYYDPVEGRSIELPSGYRQAWTNNLGDIVLSEQEDFNPNVGSNQNWQRMEKKE
jgi:hypothetical protein